MPFKDATPFPLLLAIKCACVWEDEVDDDEEDEDEEFGNITVPPIPLTIGANILTPMVLDAALLLMPTLLPLLFTVEITLKLGLHFIIKAYVNKKSKSKMVKCQH